MHTGIDFSPMAVRKKNSLSDGQRQSVEEAIVRHCAPTLAGLKTGSLFSCEAGEASDLRRWDARLSPRGVRILPLRVREDRALVYGYRPSRLHADLSDRNACRLLRDFGYPAGCSALCLAQLIRRLRENPEFPHEIGLFLGYPPEDVAGFIENQAQAYKCAGCWKVYGDEQRARRLFAAYQRCTDAYYRHWSDGMSVEQLTVAV